MASRYWVLGTADWTAINTANWSATSGGAGGETVPTTSDDVFFDANSGGGNPALGVGYAAQCHDFSCLTGAPTLIGSSGSLNISGSFDNSGKKLIIFNSPIIFNATTSETITWYSGTTLNALISASITFDGVGGVWTSQIAAFVDAMTLTNGTFDANNFNVSLTDVTTGRFSSSNSNTRVLTMGSGIWTLSGTGTVWDTSTSTNLTLNANTSQIRLTNSSATARTVTCNSAPINHLHIKAGSGTA
ncbi:hypothetical protein LCGC14_2725820, partial [marine sediment metagenome]